MNKYIPQNNTINLALGIFDLHVELCIALINIYNVNVSCFNNGEWNIHGKLAYSYWILPICVLNFHAEKVIFKRF